MSNLRNTNAIDIDGSNSSLGLLAFGQLHLYKFIFKFTNVIQKVVTLKLRVLP